MQALPLALILDADRAKEFLVDMPLRVINPLFDLICFSFLLKDGAWFERVLN